MKKIHNIFLFCIAFLLKMLYNVVMMGFFGTLYSNRCRFGSRWRRLYL